MMVLRYEGYSLDNEGILRYNGIIYLPKNDELINSILNEAHQEVYVAHLGVMKMNKNLKYLFI
jgi:hypothetical protein